MINKILTLVAVYSVLILFSCTPKQVANKSSQDEIIENQSQSYVSSSLSSRKFIEMESAALDGIDMPASQKNSVLEMVKECASKRDAAKRMSDGNDIVYENQLKDIHQEFLSSLSQELSTANYNLYSANRESLKAKIDNSSERVWEKRRLPAINIDRSTPMSQREIILSKLNLTEGQEEEIELLEAEFESKIRSSMKSGSQNRDANKHMMNKLIHEKQQKLGAILTSSQYQTYIDLTKNGIPKHVREPGQSNHNKVARGHQDDRNRMARADRQRMGGGNADPRMREGNDLEMERKGRMERDKLYQTLVLNDNQVLEMERIHQKYHDQAKRLRTDNQGNRAAVAEAMEAVQNSRIQELRSVLNPDQLERYETWRKQMSHKRGRKGNHRGE